MAKYIIEIPEEFIVRDSKGIAIHALVYNANNGKMGFGEILYPGQPQPSLESRVKALEEKLRAGE